MLEPQLLRVAVCRPPFAQGRHVILHFLLYTYPYLKISIHILSPVDVSDIEICKKDRKGGEKSRKTCPVSLMFSFEITHSLGIIVS